MFIFLNVKIKKEVSILMKSNIKKQLQNSGMTITELSSLTNIGRTTLSNIVNSDELPESTKIGTLISISNALNLKVTDLFEDTSDVYDVAYKVPFSNKDVSDGGYFGSYWVVSKNHSNNQFFIIRVIASLGDIYDPISYLWAILQLEMLVKRQDKYFYDTNPNMQKLKLVADNLKKATTENELFEVYNLKKHIADVTNVTENYINENISGYKIIENVIKDINNERIWLYLQTFFVLSIINEEPLSFPDISEVSDYFKGLIKIDIQGIMPEELFMAKMSPKPNKITELLNQNKLTYPAINDFSENDGKYFIKNMSDQLNSMIFDNYADIYLYSSNMGMIDSPRLIGNYNIDGELAKSKLPIFSSDKFIGIALFNGDDNHII